MLSAAFEHVLAQRLRRSTTIFADMASFNLHFVGSSISEMQKPTKWKNI